MKEDQPSSADVGLCREILEKAEYADESVKKYLPVIKEFVSGSNFYIRKEKVYAYVDSILHSEKFMNNSGNTENLSEWDKRARAYISDIAVLNETEKTELILLSGMNVTEGEVIIYAMGNDFCNYDPFDPSATGGTNDKQIVEIMQHYGISASAYDADRCSDEMIAEAIEGGHGIILGLNSGVLQERDWKICKQMCGKAVRRSLRGIALTIMKGMRKVEKYYPV